MRRIKIGRVRFFKTSNELHDLQQISLIRANRFSGFRILSS